MKLFFDKKKVLLPGIAGRTIAGIIPAILLVFLYRRIGDSGDAIIYAATWITYLHLCIGAFIFIRYLSANSKQHRVLDLAGFVFLVGGTLSFTNPTLWCAFFAGLFAIGVAKYFIVEIETTHPLAKKYAREKVRWETPAVLGLAVLAMIFNSDTETATRWTRVLEWTILITTSAFAVWMIGIRRIYTEIIRYLPAR